jgi:hypothetical protein
MSEWVINNKSPQALLAVTDDLSMMVYYKADGSCHIEYNGEKLVVQDLEDFAKQLMELAKLGKEHFVGEK